MRFHKPIGILLLLWPALWALWIAGKGSPQPKIVAVIIAGVVIMRAAGCVINDYADRQFDPLVARTCDRPIAAGRVTKTEALLLFSGLCLCAFGLVLLLNTMTILLSFGGAFLAATYPFMKRYTHLPQIYLGLAFGWAVPMVFAAQSESLPRSAWLLYIATIFWALAYDTMYAMVDRDEDLKIGVKSTAILFGDLDRVFIGIIQVLVMLALHLVGGNESFGYYYHAGLIAAGVFAVYQQTLIFDRSRDGCFKAFLNNNWFGAVVFLGILMQYWIC
ncbi:MAG: 4-hydroxybenzoate octaprenyltransferase [Methylococcaceae bacterium]|nr:4-hydroxybenzoate octaprenyltransferase [Methylococcaceae bacterium]